MTQQNREGEKSEGENALREVKEEEEEESRCCCFASSFSSSSYTTRTCSSFLLLQLEVSVTQPTATGAAAAVAAEAEADDADQEPDDSQLQVCELIHAISLAWRFTRRTPQRNVCSRLHIAYSNTSCLYAFAYLSAHLSHCQSPSLTSLLPVSTRLIFSVLSVGIPLLTSLVTVCIGFQCSLFLYLAHLSVPIFEVGADCALCISPLHSKPANVF